MRSRGGDHGSKEHRRVPGFREPEVLLLLAGNQELAGGVELVLEVVEAQAALVAVPAEARHVHVATPAPPAGAEGHNGPSELDDRVLLPEGEECHDVLVDVAGHLDLGGGLDSRDGAVELIDLNRHLADPAPLEGEVRGLDIVVLPRELVVGHEPIHAEVVVDREVVEAAEPPQILAVAVWVLEETLQHLSRDPSGPDLCEQLHQLLGRRLHGLFLSSPAGTSETHPAPRRTRLRFTMQANCGLTIVYLGIFVKPSMLNNSSI